MGKATEKTIRLYEESGEMFEFDARVIECSKNDSGGFDIVLDRSAFFPGGGGQMPDSGIRISGSAECRITVESI